MASVAVSVHDVAPSTWPRCASLLAMLDAIGAGPLTLLVVPWHHRLARADDVEFRHAIDARLARGDELALHGEIHLDEGPAPRSLCDRVARQVLTRCEGEFAAIDRDDARGRIDRGLALFEAMRWPVAGFVPPAWLLGPGARAALSDPSLPFSYVSVKRGLHGPALDGYLPTPNLYYSPDCAWRRTMSRALIAATLARSRDAPLLRIALHPQDVDGPGVLDDWRRIVQRVLHDRTPVGKAAWLARHPLGGRPAPARWRTA